MIEFSALMRRLLPSYDVDVLLPVAMLPTSSSFQAHPLRVPSRPLLMVRSRGASFPSSTSLVRNL